MAQKKAPKKSSKKPAKKAAPRPRPTAKAKPAKAAGKAARPAANPRAAALPKRRAPKKRTQPETLRLRSLSASLTVNDLERSLRFYRDGLGFVVTDRWEEGGELLGYMLRAGACEIGIGKDDWAKGRDRSKGTAIRLWCETTQDIDVFAARVKAQGHPLTEEPANHSWGVRAFSVDDPDGFHLSIFRRLAVD
jgi:catechol 2,3-dioxygenase-like lactoylglutathione lyase family enzyme